MDKFMQTKVVTLLILATTAPFSMVSLLYLSAFKGHSHYLKSTMLLFVNPVNAAEEISTAVRILQR